MPHFGSSYTCTSTLSAPGGFKLLFIMAYPVRNLVRELQLPEDMQEKLVEKLEAVGLDQAIDLAMLTEADAREVVGADAELEPAIRQMRELAKPLIGVGNGGCRVEGRGHSRSNPPGLRPGRFGRWCPCG